VAHHNDTPEYYLVIDFSDLNILEGSVKLKHFSIQPSNGLIFSDITQKQNLFWFEIEDFEDSKYYDKLVNKNKHEDHLFKFKFKVKEKKGEKFKVKEYEGKASLVNFNNPPDVRTPVQEPATILLFGLGILGIAGIGRKRLKKIT
jgi:hypothetical protein